MRILVMQLSYAKKKMMCRGRLHTGSSDDCDQSLNGGKIVLSVSGVVTTEKTSEGGVWGGGVGRQQQHNDNGHLARLT